MVNWLEEAKKGIKKERHEYYLKNKKRINLRSIEYRKINYQWWKDYYSGWIRQNKAQFKSLMKEQYLKHKEKWNSRSLTNKIIKGWSYRRGKYFYTYSPLFIKAECRLCGKNQELQVHHEIYPPKKDEIIKAINEGKIYYLCKSCHRKVKLFKP